MKNRGGHTLLEVVLSLAIICAIGLLTVVQPLQTRDKTMEDVKTELDAVVQTKRMTPQTYLYIHPYRKDRNKLAIGDQLITLPPDWQCVSGEILLKGGYTAPGTLLLKNDKTKEAVKIVFQLGWGEYAIRKAQW
ncbi:MAG: hypothetical protein LBT80_03655 [Lactobacillaceae bacterium]|jgi:hypothetical protein|nr:hypothetical protein [Lactobacillaceae bacterium]